VSRRTICTWCHLNYSDPSSNVMGWCRRCLKARQSNYERWWRLRRPSNVVMVGIGAMAMIAAACEQITEVYRRLRRGDILDLRGRR
jgi:hypothetical protein